MPIERYTPTHCSVDDISDRTPDMTITDSGDYVKIDDVASILKSHRSVYLSDDTGKRRWAIEAVMNELGIDWTK